MWVRPVHLLAGCLLLTVSFQAVAAPIDDVQLGTGWRFVRFVTLDEMTLNMRTTFSGPAVIIVFHYSLGPPGTTFYILGGADGGAEIDTDLATVDVTPVFSNPSTANLGIIRSEPGTDDVIILTAGAIDRIEYSLEGEGSYSVLDSGGVHSYTGTELDGGAWAKLQGGNAMLHASAARSLEFDVEHNLIGMFGSSFAGAYPGMILRSETTTDVCDQLILHYALRVWTPELATYTSDCTPRTFSGPDHRGPGRYRLDWTGAGAAYGNTPAIVWADIPWPGE